MKIEGVNTSVTEGDKPDSDPDPSPEDYPWTTITDRSECKFAMEELKDQMDGFLNDIVGVLIRRRKNPIQGMYANYREFLNYIFPNGTFNASSVLSHQECLDIEEKIYEMDDLLLLITKLGANITQSNSYDEAYKYAVQIPPLYKRRLLFNSSEIIPFSNAVQTKCNWLKNFGEDSKIVGERALQDFDKIMDERDTALRHYQSLTRLFKRLHHEVFNTILPAATLGDYYLERNAIKLKLSEAFGAAQFRHGFEELSHNSADLVEFTNAYVNAIINGRDKFVDMYEKSPQIETPSSKFCYGK